MKKEFVNYSEALNLKKLGFDNEHCFARWSTHYDGSGYLDTSTHSIYQGRDDLNRQCLAPTFSQAFKFFRENYETHSYIERLISGAFIYKIDWFEEDRHNKIVWECKSYSFEEAELECLKKLIEIAQKR